jgi:hypothetical protein
MAAAAYRATQRSRRLSGVAATAGARVLIAGGERRVDLIGVATPGQPETVVACSGLSQRASPRPAPPTG